jgi:hypothetical protein
MDSGDSLLCIPHNRQTAGVCFQAAATATIAKITIEVDNLMAKLSSGVQGTV